MQNWDVFTKMLIRTSGEGLAETGGWGLVSVRFLRHYYIVRRRKEKRDYMIIL